jgi:hypothetical protein
MLCKYGDIQYPEYQRVISRWSTVECLVCLSRITRENVNYLPAPFARTVHSGGRFPSIGCAEGRHRLAGSLVPQRNKCQQKLEFRWPKPFNGSSRLRADQVAGPSIRLRPQTKSCSPTVNESIDSASKLRHPIDNFHRLPK